MTRVNDILSIFYVLLVCVTNVFSLSNTSCGISEELQPVQAVGPAAAVVETSSLAPVGQVRVDQYPWMVSVQKKLSNGVWKHVCGGSIIDEARVLTAAQCKDSTSQSYRIVAGCNTVRDDFIHEDCQVASFEKDNFYTHRRFNATTRKNDIGVITLPQRLTFTRHVRAICIGRVQGMLIGQNATAAGWGRMRQNSASQAESERLHAVSVQVLPDRTCAKTHHTFSSIHHMCAANIVPTRGVCDGDAGGPLMIRVGEQFVQIGIISHGGSCNSYAIRTGVYTRVNSFLP